MYFITLIYLEVYFSITRGVLKAKGVDFLQAYILVLPGVS